MKKLIDTVTITSLLTTGGIFSKIASIENQPFEWLTSAYALQLDKEFYLVHSGGKWISNAFNRLIDAEDDGTIPDALSEMAKIIVQHFEQPWNKIRDALYTDYEPLENYNMEQKETPDITHTKNVKINTTTVNDIYGFNAHGVSTPSNSSNTNGEKLDNEETNKETGTRDLTRHGNIGVTTSQQMLQSEIDLRSNFNFTNHLFDDVDSILCLLAY